jgi:hypothetical protein
VRAVQRGAVERAAAAEVADPHQHPALAQHLQGVDEFAAVGNDASLCHGFGAGVDMGKFRTGHARPKPGIAVLQGRSLRSTRAGTGAVHG